MLFKNLEPPIRSSSLDVGCVLLCSLSKWSYTASVTLRSSLWENQSIKDSVSLGFFYPYYIGSMFGIIIELKKWSNCQSDAFQIILHDGLKSDAVFSGQISSILRRSPKPLAEMQSLYYVLQTLTVPAPIWSPPYIWMMFQVWMNYSKWPFATDFWYYQKHYEHGIMAKSFFTDFIVFHHSFTP